MMLYVNGSDIAKLTIGAIADDRASFSIPPKTLSVRPEEFLFTIDAWLREQHIDLKSITDLAVVIGPGSATALRTILAWANTFAFTQSIPMYGIELAPGADDRAALIDLASMSSVPMLRPVYANAPTITATKKDALRRTIS
ncbi:MAG: hypothetical protein AAB473_03115 [Patescibacteria group bacterium]